MVADEVVLINMFEVPDSDAEEFITAWEKTRDYLRAYPAHLNTALHQAITPRADFQFINIATGGPRKNSPKRSRLRGSATLRPAFAGRSIQPCIESSAPKTAESWRAGREGRSMLAVLTDD